MKVQDKFSEQGFQEEMYNLIKNNFSKCEGEVERLQLFLSIASQAGAWYGWYFEEVDEAKEVFDRVFYECISNYIQKGEEKGGSSRWTN